MAAEEAPWRRRFTAPRVRLPRWARDAPGRCLYASDEPGRWELYSWDVAGDARVQLTDRPEGTTAGAVDPAGAWTWWFADEAGGEFGRWMRQPFGAGPGQATPLGLPPAYSAGLALGSEVAVVASASDAGTSVHVVRHPLDHRLLYSHPEPAWLGELSRDDSLVCIAHSEHGDSLHPALRVMSLEGAGVSDLWDGPGLGLDPGPWSPVPGDRRMIVGHERADRARFGLWAPVSGEFQDFPVPELPGDVAATWYPDGAALLVVHRRGARATLHRLELESGGLRPLATEPGWVEAAAVRPDGALWMDWSSGADPPRVLSGGAPLLVPPGPPPPGGVPYRELRMGQVHALVAEPPAPPPHPGVFLIHGGPQAQDADAFSPKDQAWVDHGFAVVHVNYRGSAGYGRA
ncbi:MAG: S9 family peptidase, partial [Candidatus Dormibacterales bacterium]